MADDPDASKCPFTAGGKLHAGPDIFFKLGETHVRSLGLGGNWVVTRYALQDEILRDPARFSSHLAIGFSCLIGDVWPLVPLELDPPEHTVYRKLLNPWFSPSKARELESEIRALAVRLIEELLPVGRVNFIEKFAEPFPVTVFMLMMGLPLERMSTFLAWEKDLLRGESLAHRSAAAQAIKDYLLDLIAERRRRPGGDIVSFILAARLDGERISPDRLLGLCFMLFVGGLDTVASSLGFIFRALGERPELQDQLRATPSLVNAATDEFMRAFGVVTTFRYTTRDVDFHGVQFKKGDLIELPLGFAARDDRMHRCPNDIDFERVMKRTLTFSTGPHTCAGMHIARSEIRIALEEWMNRVPQFRLAAPGSERALTESVWTLDSLQLAWV
jgi:cytochrome P450